jgi:hypothetical protein
MFGEQLNRQGKTTCSRMAIGRLALGLKVPLWCCTPWCQLAIDYSDTRWKTLTDEPRASGRQDCLNTDTCPRTVSRHWKTAEQPGQSMDSPGPRDTRLALLPLAISEYVKTRYLIYSYATRNDGVRKLDFPGSSRSLHKRDRAAGIMPHRLTHMASLAQDCQNWRPGPQQSVVGQMSNGLPSQSA